MVKMIWPAILFLPYITACYEAGNIPQGNNNTAQHRTAAIPANVGSIPLPEGYTRIKYPKGSQAAYLRSIDLSGNKKVYLFNGQEKENQTAQYAV